MKWLVGIALAIGALGCKSGPGERCQVSSDCESPLTCNMATQTCAGVAGGGIDATLPVFIDAGPDAPADARLDAPRDAM